METAKALALAGYDIVFVDRPGKQGERVADILMNGDTWEMKSPRSDSLKAIERNVKRARNQSPLRRPRLEAHEKSPGRRNREGAEKVREDHQGDKAPPARRPTRKRHNHSLNLWYDCASKRPNGTQFTFLGRFCCFPWFSKTIFSSQHLSAEITSYFIEKEGGARQSAAFLESLVMPRIRRPRRARRRPRRATTRSRRSGPAGRPRGRSPARTRPTKQPAGDGRDRCDDPVALSRQDQADLGYNSQSSISPSNY